MMEAFFVPTLWRGSPVNFRLSDDFLGGRYLAVLVSTTKVWFSALDTFVFFVFWYRPMFCVFLWVEKTLLRCLSPKLGSQHQLHICIIPRFRVTKGGGYPKDSSQQGILDIVPGDCPSRKEISFDFLRFCHCLPIRSDLHFLLNQECPDLLWFGPNCSEFVFRTNQGNVFANPFCKSPDNAPKTATVIMGGCILVLMCLLQN